MAMPVDPGPTVQADIAETLFDMAAYSSSPFTRDWDVSPDGQRLLMIKRPGAATTEADGQLEIILVQNWFEELERLVPTN